MLYTYTDQLTLKTQAQSCFLRMQQTHLQNQAHKIHLDCIVLLLCAQGKTEHVMNNLISTWKVTSGFFQKSIQSLRRKQFSGWMCFPPRLQGHWRQMTTSPLIWSPCTLTHVFLYVLYLARRKSTGSKKGAKNQKDGDDILGFVAAFRSFVSPPFVTVCICI